jgi:hypothetical protein
MTSVEEHDLNDYLEDQDARIVSSKELRKAGNGFLPWAYTSRAQLEDMVFDSAERKVTCKSLYDDDLSQECKEWYVWRKGLPLDNLDFITEEEIARCKQHYEHMYMPASDRNEYKQRARHMAKEVPNLLQPRHFGILISRKPKTVGMVQWNPFRAGGDVRFRFAVRTEDNVYRVVEDELLLYAQFTAWLAWCVFPRITLNRIQIDGIVYPLTTDSLWKKCEPTLEEMQFNPEMLKTNFGTDGDSYMELVNEAGTHFVEMYEGPKNSCWYIDDACIRFVVDADMFDEQMQNNSQTPNSSDTQQNGFMAAEESEPIKHKKLSHRIIKDSPVHASLTKGGDTEVTWVYSLALNCHIVQPDEDTEDIENIESYLMRVEKRGTEPSVHVYGKQTNGVFKAREPQSQFYDATNQVALETEHSGFDQDPVVYTSRSLELEGKRKNVKTIAMSKFEFVDTEGDDDIKFDDENAEMLVPGLFLTAKSKKYLCVLGVANAKDPTFNCEIICDAYKDPGREGWGLVYNPKTATILFVADRDAVDPSIYAEMPLLPSALRVGGGDDGDDDAGEENDSDADYAEVSATEQSDEEVLDPDDSPASKACSDDEAPKPEPKKSPAGYPTKNKKTLAPAKDTAKAQSPAKDAPKDPEQPSEKKPAPKKKGGTITNFFGNSSAPDSKTKKKPETKQPERQPEKQPEKMQDQQEEDPDEPTFVRAVGLDIPNGVSDSEESLPVRRSRNVVLRTKRASAKPSEHPDKMCGRHFVDDEAGEVHDLDNDSPPEDIGEYDDDDDFVAGSDEESSEDDFEDEEDIPTFKDLCRKRRRTIVEDSDDDEEEEDQRPAKKHRKTTATSVMSAMDVSGLRLQIGATEQMFGGFKTWLASIPADLVRDDKFLKLQMQSLQHSVKSFDQVLGALVDVSQSET